MVRQPEPDAAQPLLDVKQVARRLNVSERSVWRLIRDGRIATVRVGKAVRVIPRDLAAAIEKMRG